MNKLFITVFLTLLFFNIVYSQIAFDEILEKSLTVSEDSYWRGSVSTSDGGFVISANILENSIYSACLIKFDSLGNKEWKKLYKGKSHTGIQSVIQTLDGGYAFTGKARTGMNNANIWIVKTDKKGKTEWYKTYGENFYDSGESIVETRNNDFVVVGTKRVGIGKNNERNNIIFLKFNKDGILLKQEVIKSDNYESASRIVLDKQENIIISGRTSTVKRNEKTNSNVLVTKINQEVENIWRVVLKNNGVGYSRDMFNYKNEVIILAEKGYLDSWKKKSIWLIKINQTSGEVLQEKLYSNDFTEMSYSISQVNNDFYLLLKRGISNNQVYLSRIDGAFNVKWETKLNTNFKYSGELIKVSDTELIIGGNIGERKIESFKFMKIRRH